MVSVSFVFKFVVTLHVWFEDFLEYIISLWLVAICNQACWACSNPLSLFFNWLEYENVTVL